MAELDYQQRAAVESGPIDLFIAAGAGSGKTRVLTERFVRAVLGDPPYEPTEPSSLLTVTFTEAAAGELAQRARASLAATGAIEQARRTDEAWISTIHSMCSRILREHAFEAGIDPRFAVASEMQAAAVAEEALDAVARELVARDEDTAALIDAYGYVEVAEAVRSLHADVRSLGCDAAALRTLEEHDCADALAQVAVRARELADEARSLKSTPIVESTAAALSALAEELREASKRPIDSDAAGHLAELPGRYAFRGHGSVDGLTALAAAARELLADVGALGAQLAVGAHESALLRLLDRYAAAYTALMRERSLLDFEDLQLGVVALFTAHRRLAERYRERFRMVMVDEFQDTNALQCAVIEWIASGNVCTVGDEQQSIYGFRHADVGVFQARAAAVAEHRPLETNYRSAPTLLAAIGELFSADALFGAAAMRLVPGRVEHDDGWPPDEPRLRVAFVGPQPGVAARDVEAAAIADEVVRMLERGAAPGETAVLLRAVRGWAELVERELRERSVPTFVTSGGTFFERPEVAEAEALLRLVDNVRDDEALFTVLAGRITGLSDDALFRLAERAERGPLWSALAAPDVALAPADRAVLDRTVRAIAAARDARGSRPLAELLLGAALALDYDLTLLASGPDGRRAWANVVKLARLAGEFERDVGLDVGAFLEHLATRRTHAGYEPQAPVTGEHASAVRIMSIHAAKGLEFPYVVVGGLGSRPRCADTIEMAVTETGPLLGMRHRTAGGGEARRTTAHDRVSRARQDAERAEAARVLYVACTRAERALTLVAATDPAAEAAGTLAGSIRAALGMEGAGAISSGVHAADSGRLAVEVVEVSAGAMETHAAVPACASPVEPIEFEPAGREPTAGAPAVVSYSGLARYEACPYRFYASSVLRLATSRESVDDATRAFGSAIHRILAENPTGSASAERIGAAAEALGGSPEVRTRLEGSLAAFAASGVAAALAAADQVTTETPIAVGLGETVLVGSIDALAWRGNEALVVDYKTGDGPLAGDEAREHYELQGVCYALAALTAGARSVRVVFLELERACRETVYEYAAEDEARLRIRLDGILERMRRGEWAPRGVYDRPVCGECPALGGICPVTPPGGAG